MDYALIVGVLEGAEDLHGEMHRLLDAEPALLLDILLEGDALDILHDDILELVAVVDVEHLDYVGMRKHGDGL